MRQAQDLEPDDPFAQGLRQTYNDLDAERRATLAALGELDAADQTTPARLTVEDAGLLDALPYLTLKLAEAPEPLLRGLFEITNLTVQLHPDSDDVTITIRLPADELTHLADAAERITNPMTATELPAQQDRHSCADAERAPGAARAGCTRIANPSSTLGRLGQAGCARPESRWSLRRASRWLWSGGSRWRSDHLDADARSSTRSPV